jgi:hypothetical protein
MEKSTKLQRPWKVIAQELACEHDSDRVAQLSEELGAAIDAQRSSHSFAAEIDAVALNPARVDRRPSNGDLTETNPYLEFRSNPWLSGFLKSAIEASGADFGNVQLFDPAQQALRIVAQVGFGKEFLDFFDMVRDDDDCACGSALKTGSRIVVADVATAAVFRDSGSRDVILRANVRAVQSTPLIDPAGKLLGVLSTHYKHSQLPSPNEWKHVDDLAADIVAKMQTPPL